MLTSLCKELNNYFCKEKDAINGKFTIEENTIYPNPALLNGQYFRISGSFLNDGVHLNSEEMELLDEPEFVGKIWPMRVPPDVIELANAIEEWREKNEAIDSANMSPFQSESFDIYSYSKGSRGQSTNGGTAGGAAVTWQEQFAKQLNKYRRMWGI